MMLARKFYPYGVLRLSDVGPRFWLEKVILRGYFRIRYPDPAIKVNDTVKINLADGKWKSQRFLPTHCVGILTTHCRQDR